VDGAPAVEMGVALQPHSVILDMTMPVMDGGALALIKTRAALTPMSWPIRRHLGVQEESPSRRRPGEGLRRLDGEVADPHRVAGH